MTEQELNDRFVYSTPVPGPSGILRILWRWLAGMVPRPRDKYYGYLVVDEIVGKQTWGGLVPP